MRFWSASRGRLSLSMSYTRAAREKSASSSSSDMKIASFGQASSQKPHRMQRSMSISKRSGSRSMKRSVSWPSIVIA